jgi:hypothetical protein
MAGGGERLYILLDARMRACVVCMEWNCWGWGLYVRGMYVCTGLTDRRDAGRGRGPALARLVVRLYM